MLKVCDNKEQLSDWTHPAINTFNKNTRASKEAVKEPLFKQCRLSELTCLKALLLHGVHSLMEGK